MITARRSSTSRAVKQFTPVTAAPCSNLSLCPGADDPNAVGWLPSAARPDRHVYTIVHTLNGTYAEVSINPQGQIEMIGARAPAVTDYGFVSLEGVTYPLDATDDLVDGGSDAGYGAAPGSAYSTEDPGGPESRALWLCRRRPTDSSAVFSALREVPAARPAIHR